MSTNNSQSAKLYILVHLGITHLSSCHFYKTNACVVRWCDSKSLKWFEQFIIIYYEKNSSPTNEILAIIMSTHTQHKQYSLFFFFFTTSWNVPLYFVSSTHLHNLLRSLLRCIRQGNAAESGFRSCDVFPSSAPSRISLWVIPSRPRLLLRCLDSGSGSSRRPILRSPHLQHWVENHLHQRLDFIREAMKGLPHGKRRERTYTHTHTHTNARTPAPLGTSIET